MIDGLPPLLAEIAEVAGLDAALAIAEARGGQKVYIPTPDRVGPTHWLAEVVGLDAARKLGARFGSCHLELPFGPAASVRRLRGRIARMIAEGASSNTIAAACGVTFRTVTRHRTRARGDDAQGDLFQDGGHLSTALSRRRLRMIR